MSAYAELDRAPLSPRDLTALRAIQTHWEQKGYGPSVRDLSTAMANHSTSVAGYYIKKLEARGLVHVPRENGMMLSHTMRLTSFGRAALDEAEAAL